MFLIRHLLFFFSTLTKKLSYFKICISFNLDFRFNQEFQEDLFHQGKFHLDWDCQNRNKLFCLFSFLFLLSNLSNYFCLKRFYLMTVNLLKTRQKFEHQQSLIVKLKAIIFYLIIAFQIKLSLILIDLNLFQRDQVQNELLNFLLIFWHEGLTKFHQYCETSHHFSSDCMFKFALTWNLECTEKICQSFCIF